jgi:PAS domain S-box-containing protein
MFGWWGTEYRNGLAMTESNPADQTNALLAAVVASSMDAVFSIDVNAKVQTWNLAAERLYGYTAAEAIGQPLGFLAPNPADYAPGTRFQRVLRGEQIYFETSRRRKDGSLVEVGISSGPIRDSSGMVVGVSIVHRDVSERKRTERNLHQILEWLEMAQETGDVAPWGYDLDSGEVRWTKQLYRQLGYETGGATPSLSAFRERVHPEDKVRLDDIRDKESKAEPGTQFQTALRLIRRDGTLSWIDRRSRVIEQDGRRRIVGVNVDITERKGQEDNLRFIMGELSHRTKNLLSVVQAMASQTARYSATFVDFEERFLGRLRALSQSHDLLVRQNWAGAPLRDLILAQLSPFVEDKGRVQANGPSIFLRAEAAQSLGIILHELATNASKYGALSVPAGKIMIRWELAPKSVRLSWRETNGPAVKPPDHPGFGQIVIERMACDMFGDTARLELLPTGVCWNASIPESLIVKPSTG